MLLKLKLSRLLTSNLFFNYFLLKDLNCIYFNYKIQKNFILIFIIIIFSCRDWIICASAVFLEYNNYFSNFFFDVKFLFFVIRKNHDKSLFYHRKLIEQKFEWIIVDVKSCDSLNYYKSLKNFEKTLIFYLINTFFSKSRFLTCINFKIITIIHVIKYY